MTFQVWLLCLLVGTPLLGQQAPRFTARAIAPDPSQSQREIAPGIIATLYGHNLGPEKGCVAKVGRRESYPTELCGARVFFGELPAPLLYVQKGQINLRIPEPTPEDAYSAVRVIYKDRSSPAVQVWVANRLKLPPLEEHDMVAEEFWKRWQAASSAVSFAEWEMRYPGETCQGPPQGGDGLSANEQWCHRCLLEEPHRSFEWSFYAFTLREPLACRLNRHWARLTDVSETSLDEVYRSLAERLTEQYGAGDDPGRIHAQGAAYWRRLQRWRNDWGEIYLYLSKPLFEPSHLGLLARAQSLLDAMAEDHDISILHWGPKAQDRDDLGRELAKALESVVNCIPGQETYQEVITSGERFLAEHPKGRRRLEAAFLVAQAYETQWSLSQASGEGAEGARQAAIRYYGEVMAAKSDEPKALYARRRLPRLKLGIDTNQRRFFCSMH